MQQVQEFAQAVKKILSTPRKIVVTNHINPDGDAMGSALALAGLLKAKGQHVQVIVPNDYPQNLKWLEGDAEVMIYTQNEIGCKAIIAKAEVIFHLDYNSLKRAGPLQEVLTESSATKLMIDHHQQPDNFAQAKYSDTGMSSTCEMIFHFLEAMKWQNSVTKGIAEAIYTGITTDTGNFRFDSTTSTTHQTAAFLLSKGVNPGALTSQIYDSNTQARLKLLSRALDKMEVLSEYSAAIITLTRKDFEEIGHVKGITEGFVNYGLSLAGIELSVFAYPGNEGVKMSFRSKTQFNVNTFARQYFNGGGHNRAAGALSPYATLSETVKQLKAHLKNHKNEIVTT